MKFPVRVSDKKYISKMETQKNNEKNNLASAQEANPLEQVIKEPETIPQPEMNPPEDIPDNANMPAPENLWSESADKSELLENFDKDGKLFGTFKRISFERTHSWDDSGFNSCASDDRDDLSVTDRLSYDLSLLADNDDDNSSDKKKKASPRKFRRRSYSLDSESSDLSDSHNFLNSKVVSAASGDIEKNLVLWKDANVRLVNEDNSSLIEKDGKRNSNSSCCNNQGKPKSIIDSTSNNKSISIPTSDSSAIPKRRRGVGKNQNSNAVNGSIIKNLKSYKRHSTSRTSTAACFKDNGLFTLISCILYTLFLGFLVSLCGLIISTFKFAMFKEDLQDLKENVTTTSRSRPHEKSSRLDKRKTISNSTYKNGVCV